MTLLDYPLPSTVTVHVVPFCCFLLAMMIQPIYIRACLVITVTDASWDLSSIASRIVIISLSTKTATASHTFLGDHWQEHFKFSAGCLVNLLRQLGFQTPALPTTPWFLSIKRLNLMYLGHLRSNNPPFKHWGPLLLPSRRLYRSSWIGSNKRWFKTTMRIL